MGITLVEGMIFWTGDLEGMGLWKMRVLFMDRVKNAK
jgi:hypothetical protein